MKSIGKFTLTIFIFIAFCTILSGCSLKPDNRMMMEDLRKIPEIIDEGKYDWQIEGVERLTENQDGKIYTATVNVTLKNPQYESAQRKVDLKYINYDNDGWQLDGYENVTEITKAHTSGAVLDESAKKDLRSFSGSSKDLPMLSDDDVIKVTEHHTSDDNTEDELVLDVISPGEFFDLNWTVNVIYTVDSNGLWKMSIGKISKPSVKFNQINKCYFRDKTVDSEYYKLESINLETESAVVTVVGWSEKGTIQVEARAIFDNDENSVRISFLLNEEGKNGYHSRSNHLILKKDGLYGKPLSSTWYFKMESFTELPNR